MKTNNDNGAAVSSEELRQAWQELKTRTPHLYARDAARQLGVPEARLIALGNGDTSFRLHIPDYAAFFNGLAQFGETLVLARNDGAVLEKDSVLHFEEKDHYFIATGDGVRLAFGKASLAHVFVVHAEKWVRRGIQFFDASGNAVFKLYFRDDAKIPAFDEWIKPWLSADQSPALATIPVPAPALPPTHCGAHAHEGTSGHCGAHKSVATLINLPPESYKTLLEAAAKSGEPITLSLANANSFFSVTATIQKTAPSGPWFNILDDTLHMHLSVDAVKSASAFLGAASSGDITDAASRELKVAFKNSTGASILWIRIAAEGPSAIETLKSKI
ncbi:MAG: hypothetical protein LBV54_07425 [Puniceicoccales bacterium]|jgi:putative hemin transport protein|nr:hypothetical protein [Puniceicoccales bacterium]